MKENGVLNKIVKQENRQNKLRKPNLPNAYKIV